MFPEKFIHVCVARRAAGTYVLAQQEVGAARPSVNRTKLCLGSQVESLLRQRVRRDTSLELKDRRVTRGLAPDSLAKQVCLNDPFVRGRKRSDAMFQIILGLHSQPPHERVNHAAAEVNPDDRSELADCVSLARVDSGQLSDLR